MNLGSPDSPSPSDVRKYLREFLMDGRVLDAPWRHASRRSKMAPSARQYSLDHAAERLRRLLRNLLAILVFSGETKRGIGPSAMIGCL